MHPASEAFVDESVRDEPGVDPIARAARVVELAGLCLSLYYVWTLIRQEPGFEIAKRSWLYRVQKLRRRVHFMRSDATIADAAAIVARGS